MDLQVKKKKTKKAQPDEWLNYDAMVKKLQLNTLGHGKPHHMSLM